VHQLFEAVEKREASPDLEKEALGRREAHAGSELAAPSGQRLECRLLRGATMRMDFDMAERIRRP
jgi:hypothetical protein